MVFVDISPDNPNTAGIYNSLWELYDMSDKQVYPIPIVCSEYYFIQSIANTPAIINPSELDICLPVNPRKHSRLVVSPKDKRKCKNFERYCKMFLLKNVSDCVLHTRGDEIENLKYGFYYEKDCLCPSPEEWCALKSLVEKAYAYVGQFPCFPLGWTGPKPAKSLGEQDVLQLNRQLCEFHNRKIREFAPDMADSGLTLLKPLLP